MFIEKAENRKLVWDKNNLTPEERAQVVLVLTIVSLVAVSAVVFLAEQTMRVTGSIPRRTSLAGTRITIEPSSPNALNYRKIF
jgi:hypothetical protein